MINRLSSRTRQLVEEHNERTGHFVRACGAFAYITIPAISCPMIRFSLYLLSSQVALANECLGQADACLEGAINLVMELPAGEEQWIMANLSNLLSTLLVQPVRLTRLSVSSVCPSRPSRPVGSRRSNQRLILSYTWTL